MTRFSDRDGEDRMRLRAVLESYGAEVMGYCGDGVQVALPRSMRAWEWPEIGPFRLVSGSAHDFPLGSDKPPAHLRHPSSYGTGPAFEHSNWHFAVYEVAVEGKVRP